tara:strand:- start:33 stop:497 length:465 start_codon:yes stop_codon:yes gene_type:complete
MYLPSVEVLKVLGYRNSKDVVFTERNPEQKLFLYVVINAIEDVLVHQSDRKSSFIKCEAHNWLIGYSDDFIKICEWALLDPSSIRSSYIKCMKKRTIRFTQKQINWQNYRNTFFEMKKLSEREKRRKKGTLRSLRIQAHCSSLNFTSTIFLSVI